MYQLQTNQSQQAASDNNCASLFFQPERQNQAALDRNLFYVQQVPGHPGVNCREPIVTFPRSTSTEIFMSDKL